MTGGANLDGAGTGMGSEDLLSLDIRDDFDFDGGGLGDSSDLWS